jgi:hypothetical protein
MGVGGHVHRPFRGREGGNHPVDAVSLTVEAVEAEFILDKEENQETTGNPDGQADDIEDGIQFIPGDIPEGYL